MAYSLSTHYAGQGLLDSFNFFTGEEPSNGFVDYKSREDAVDGNLVSVDEFNRVKLGVDSINTYSTSDKGRPSVRLTSNDAFTHGLFIADFAHMPSSTCGTWPAFWAFNNEEDGKLWPMGGEIDIIEGANTAEKNLFSAHTTPGCQAPITGFTGAQGRADCSLSPGNVGCNYVPVSHSATYGDAFNAEGGGVYALEWDSQDLKIWHFPRTAIPDDISRAPLSTPDPSTWGPPQALFGGPGCEADSHFFNMSLVINTNFCGAYAGNNWGVTDKCNELAPTCEEYVAGNPSSFINAFWQVNYIDVYKKSGPGSKTLAPPFSNSTFTNNTTSSGSSIPSNSTTPSNTTLSNNIVSSNSTTFLKNGTTPQSPPLPATTSPSFFGNGTALITRTRTITISTVRKVTSTAEPTPTGNVPASSIAMNGWTLLGCFESPDSHKAFSQVPSSSTMDNKACMASCAGHRYAGISGETCYCADTLTDATAVANEKCSSSRNSSNAPSTKMAPFSRASMVQTNSTKFHNAAISDTSKPNNNNNNNMRLNPLLSRAADDPSDDILLTVYGHVSDEVPPGSPGMGGGGGPRISDSDKDDLSGSPSSRMGGGGNPPSQGDVRIQAPTATATTVTTVTSAVTVTFTTICPTDAARLVTQEYITTLTTQQQQPCHLCTITTPPPVPMATCTETCRACGPHGESTVTLTVPEAVVAGTGGGHVVAYAVQTVVPVLALNPPASSSSSSSSSLTTARHATPTLSIANTPVVAAGASTTTVGGKTRGFLKTLGYGFGLWFVVFWIGIVL